MGSDFKVVGVACTFPIDQSSIGTAWTRQAPALLGVDAGQAARMTSNTGPASVVEIASDTLAIT